MTTTEKGVLPTEADPGLREPWATPGMGETGGRRGQAPGNKGGERQAAVPGQGPFLSHCWVTTPMFPCCVVHGTFQTSVLHLTAQDLIRNTQITP